MPVREGKHIAFFGSSLVSGYWNEAATYYRGIIRALSAEGYRITFYEPDAFERQNYRDIPDPPWAKVVVYSARNEDAVREILDEAQNADLIIKASGVGVFDQLLEAAVVETAEKARKQRPYTLSIFWDVDAPATIDRIHHNPDDPFQSLIPRYDLILTNGGGKPIVDAYQALGARQCVPVYNALDPLTHYPVSPDSRFASDLGFCGDRLPDREMRVREFLFKAASTLPTHRFLLAGSGWPVISTWRENSAPDHIPETRAGHRPEAGGGQGHKTETDQRRKAKTGINPKSETASGFETGIRAEDDAGTKTDLRAGTRRRHDTMLPENVCSIGHLYTQEHNAFHCSARVVLNISREGTARYGFSPSIRIFEAAGAGACIITDAWEGLEMFLEPGTEILTAKNGLEVAEHLLSLTPATIQAIGQAARRRVLAEHTYEHRARQLVSLLETFNAEGKF
ncbi:MAG: glycosyltransferase [bacterium]